MRFYLGTHQPNWLWDVSVIGSQVPMFVSRRRLQTRRTDLPPARRRWALDSGGFTELSMHGHWRLDAPRYVEQTRRWSAQLGGMDWAASMDWMVEPDVRARTGASIDRHQQLTVTSYLELCHLAPEVAWVPVLQGWSEPGGDDLDSYLRCWERFERAGVDLRAVPVVGVGSVCRRQGTQAAQRVVAGLAQRGLRGRLHLFGAKTTGLARYATLVGSADSLAWSYDARRADPLPGCTHAGCQNCPRWALRWYQRVLAKLGGPAAAGSALPSPAAAGASAGGAVGWQDPLLWRIRTEPALAAAAATLAHPAHGRPLSTAEQSWLLDEAVARGLPAEALSVLAHELLSREPTPLPDFLSGGDVDRFAQVLATARQVLAGMLDEADLVRLREGRRVA